MSPDKSLQNLFNAALERNDPAERDRFLEEACGKDTGLRERVERLLRAQDEVGAFMAQPSRKPSGVDLDQTRGVDIPLTEKPGDRIGRYKLLQQIGEGGCGVVYMAEQEEPVRRRVALKVIKLGMDTRQVIARFEAERQALAMMDHPNIAKVFDAGATGVPLTLPVDTLSPRGGEGRGDGDAGHPRPSEGSGVGGEGVSAGRPYFVMELVRGTKITEFCDQNQLSTEERLKLFIQVCQAIQHAHQKGIIHRDIKPSNILVTINDGVPVPKVIDFGIAKATAGRLTDQTLFTAFEQFIGTPAYMSPEQAVLTSLDIDTRTDIYSLGVLLYELLTGTTPFDAKELLAKGLDEMRRTICDVEPPKPSTRLTQTAKYPVRNSRSENESAIGHRLSAIPSDLDWIVMKCLEKDRKRRYETANGLASDIRRHLDSEPVVARPPSRWYEFQKTVRRHKFGFAAATALVLVLSLGVVISTWQAVRATRAEKAAEAETQRAVAAEKQATETLKLVAAEHDAKELARRDAEAISSFLTEMFESTQPVKKLGGREAKVADVLDSAAEKLRKDLADHPDRRFKLQTTIGTTYARLGINQEAIRLLEEAQDYYEREVGRDCPDLLFLKRTLARCYFFVGRENESTQMNEEVLRLASKLYGKSNKYSVETMGRLISSYTNASRKQDAMKMMRERITVLETKLVECRMDFGPENSHTLEAMLALSIAYSDSERKEEALALREELLRLRRMVSGPEHPNTLLALWYFSNSCHDVGRREEALALREELLALRRKVDGPEGTETIAAMGLLARTYCEAGRTEDAVKLRKQMLAACRKVYGPEHPLTLKEVQNLASYYHEAGRQQEEIKLQEELLVLRRKLVGPTHADTLNAMTQLAISYRVAGGSVEAIALEEESLRLKRQNLPPGHSYTIESLENLAACYERTGRKAEAEALRQEARELKAKAKAK